MAKQYDVKKEWEKTKKQLIKFGKEANLLARKGEQELVRISKATKIHIDSTAVGLKKEKLYYQIGKECVKLKDLSKASPTLKKLLTDYGKIDKEQRDIQGKLKAKKAKKSAPKAKKKTVRKATKKATKRKTTKKS